MKIIHQHDQRDCGAACLAMIAGHYGLKLSVCQCRDLTKTDKSGTNLYGLIDGAKQIGLLAKGLQGFKEDLIEGLRKGEIQYPFIVHVISEDAMLHYVVIAGEKHNKLLVFDPAKGKTTWTWDVFVQNWTGYLVTFQKTDSFQKGNCVKGGFLKFFSLLQGQYCKLAGILVISLLIAAIGIMGAFVFEVVIDNFAIDTGYYGETLDVQEEDNHAHETTEKRAGLNGLLDSLLATIDRSEFYVIFVLLIGLYLFQSVIQFLRGYLIAEVSRKIDVRLSLEYYNHVVDLPVSSIQVRQTGEYLSRFSDTSTIRLAVSGATLTLLLDSVMVIGCGTILFLENSRLFYVSLLMVFFYAVIVMIYRKPVERSNRDVMENHARVQSYFKETIDGVETVKSSCANEQIKSQTTEKFTRFVSSAFRNSLLALSQDTIADTIELIGTVIILWMGFEMVLGNQITIGSLITFYALLSYFTTPIKNLIELQPTIQTALVAADRLNDVLDLKKEEIATRKIALPDVLEWRFDGVDFRYGNRQLTLKNIDFFVRRGEKVAIVGESGSGKTTMAKLLLRFYEPEQGKITANGIDLRDIDLTKLRQSVAYVDQNTFLFSDTIKNNLKLGRLDVSEEELERVCRISGVDKFIRDLPYGYETPLDENGVNLSGGQRQRLAIARALLKKPQLLVLDEATSNLDTITESGIKETLFDMNETMTCVIIAHRLSTVRHCDRIYVMERGRIVEEGSHDILLQKNGKYAELWRRQ